MDKKEEARRKLEEAEHCIEEIEDAFGVPHSTVHAEPVPSTAVNAGDLQGRLQEAERCLKKLEEVAEGRSMSPVDQGNVWPQMNAIMAAERIALFGFLKSVLDRTQVSYAKFVFLTVFLIAGGFAAALFSDWMHHHETRAPANSKREVVERVIEREISTLSAPQEAVVRVKTDLKAKPVVTSVPRATTVAAQAPVALPAQVQQERVQSPEEIQARQELNLADKMFSSIQNSSVAASPEGQEALGQASLSLRQAHSLVELGQYADAKKMALQAGVKLLSIKRQQPKQD